MMSAVDTALAEASLVAGIMLAGRSDWRAAAFILERRWPERWALRARAIASAGEPDD